MSQSGTVAFVNFTGFKLFLMALYTCDTRDCVAFYFQGLRDFSCDLCFLSGTLSFFHNFGEFLGVKILDLSEPLTLAFSSFLDFPQQIIDTS